MTPTPQPRTALQGDSTDAPINDRMAIWAAVRMAAGVSLTDEQTDLAVRSLEANRWYLRFEAEAAALDVEVLENFAESGYCPGCKVAIDLHPLDAEGVDVGRCPTPREALDALYARLRAERGAA